MGGNSAFMGLNDGARAPSGDFNFDFSVELMFMFYK